MTSEVQENTASGPLSVKHMQVSLKRATVEMINLSKRTSPKVPEISDREKLNHVDTESEEGEQSSENEISSEEHESHSARHNSYHSSQKVVGSSVQEKLETPSSSHSNRRNTAYPEKGSVQSNEEAVTSSR